ncbi:MAG: hypothetical protein CVU64_16170 [Deltaproteobacteria bacterium HGW-Deltaproteobacteria-21]|nr:MAG: hypothetical protein CVU64_16170 [Deltaproteobacteria bacterium HGW-Deltaproteobacteria-21]
MKKVGSGKVEVGIEMKKVGSGKVPLFCARGFTLMEVLVSMAIMAVALFAVFRLQGQNLDLQTEASFITLANQLGDQRMAELQVKPDLNEGRFSGDFGADHPDFQYEEEITKVANRKHLFRVKVTVIRRGEDLTRGFSVEGLLYRQES